MLATPATVVEWQIRAWWSQLFVPQNDTNLRIRYACSLLCLELPTQNTASGPDSLRMASSLSPISLIACSQLIFWYLPLTSFIGDFSRYSPWPCSRTDAPLAQCAPRFSGESNTGFCRVHTPFSTVASTAQPTEQCVQTVRLTSALVAAPSFCAVGRADGAEGKLARERPGPGDEARALQKRPPVHRRESCSREAAKTRTGCGSSVAVLG